MRMSRMFGTTLRKVSSEIEIVSHQYLLRGGYIKQIAAGIFSYLPIAYRVMNRITDILRKEMESIGGQEVRMPVVQPADLWMETGRWTSIDREMGRLTDRNDRLMALAMTHEETLTDLARSVIGSYRQLPQLVYHIQTKWRDDPRPRAGLIRAREFTMKDSYSLDKDQEGLDQQYQAHYQAYFNIFRRCGLADVLAVESDTGMMGGQMAHEFIALADIGEDTIIICNECGYMANRQIAAFTKTLADDEAMQPVEKIATPDTATIDDLAALLDIPTMRTAKALLMMATITGEDQERFVFVVIRGDMELNETKLSNAIGAQALRPATEDEIRAVGAVPGYASPVGLGDDVMVVVDDAIVQSPNLVAGANEEGYHLLNVNYERNYQAAVVADIAAAGAGDACPVCQTVLRAERGIEVGNIFKLGTWYSEAMGCTFTDENGRQQSVIMGSYGIGVGRLMQTVAELSHDEYGIIWPVTIAPYQVVLVVLRGGDEVADNLYDELSAAGIDVLYDDRDEGPGVKFNDADLLGIPVRITVGKRALDQGGVEVKLRHEKDAKLVLLDDIVSHVEATIRMLHEAIEVTMTEEVL